MMSQCHTESYVSTLLIPRVICTWSHLCLDNATSFLGNTQPPDSDITVRHGHVADTIIMQLRSRKILPYYSVEPFYSRCLDKLVSLQKEKLLVATQALANQTAPIVISITNDRYHVPEYSLIQC